MDINNNAILLTGASSGIGNALLKKLYALGNQILVTSRSESSLEELCEEYPNLLTCVCELGDPASVAKLIEFVKSDFSQLNMLINNAGVQYNYEWLYEPDVAGKIEEEIRINLTSPLQLIEGLLPVLMDKSHASIINLTSTLAFVPKQSAPVYCATKAGLHNFSKALRYQLENTNIRVVEVIPPLVDTPMTEGRGSGKISPDKLVDEFIVGLQGSRDEINIGKSGLLRFIQRLSPGLADSILKKS